MAYSRRGGRYRSKDSLQAQIRSSVVPREVTDNAACNSNTAHLFESDAPKEDHKAALAICNVLCPVKDLCLVWAIENPSAQHGVSGGVRWPSRGHKKRTA